MISKNLFFMVILLTVGSAVEGADHRLRSSKVNQDFIKKLPQFPAASPEMLSQKQEFANQKADSITRCLEKFIHERSLCNFHINVKKAEGSATTAFVTVTKGTRYYVSSNQEEKKGSIITKRPITDARELCSVLLNRTVICSGEMPVSQLFASDLAPEKTRPDLLRFKDEIKKTEFLGNATAREAAEFLLGKIDTCEQKDEDAPKLFIPDSSNPQPALEESDDEPSPSAQDFRQKRKAIDIEILAKLKHLINKRNITETDCKRTSHITDWDLPTTRVLVNLRGNKTHSCIYIEEAPASSDGVGSVTPKYLFKFFDEEKSFFAYATTQEAADILLTRDWLALTILGFKKVTIFR